jgi:hypothetical protein
MKMNTRTKMKCIKFAVEKVEEVKAVDNVFQ